MAGWVWTGGADISTTLVSAGAPPAITSWSIDVLSVPSGLVTSPLTGAILFVSAIIRIHPSAGMQSLDPPNDPQFSQFAAFFVDANGTELIRRRSTPNLADTDPWDAAIPNTGSWVDNVLGPIGLNGGGTIRFKGAFSNGVNEPLSGTVVAAIYDTTTPTEIARITAFDITGNPPSLPPFANTVDFLVDGGTNPTFKGIFDHGACNISGIATTPPAPLPTQGGPDWIDNLVSRVNGIFFASISDYVGPAGDAIPVWLTNVFPPGQTYYWCYFDIAHRPGTTSNFVAMIG